MSGSRSGAYVNALRDLAERTAKLLPWWFLFGCIIISSVTAFYEFLTRGHIFLAVPSRPPLRILGLVDFSAAALLMFGLLALKPPSLCSLARKMLTICLLESVALTVISAIAPWVGTHLLNLVLIAVYSVAVVTALALVSVQAGAKSKHF
jgi:hypothetical protein